jgi:predicted N-acetyltransferase YhbS
VTSRERALKDYASRHRLSPLTGGRRWRRSHCCANVLPCKRLDAKGTAMIKVRDAVDQDAAAIAGLLTELGYPASVPDIPARLRLVTEAPGRVFVAEDAGEVVGLASVTRLILLHRAGPVALLSALVVHPGHRGEGIGGALVEMTERQAAAWGCESLELTSRDDRHRTHRFYVGMGFESGSRKFVRPIAS